MYQQKTSAFHRQVSFESKLSLLPSAHYSKTVQERLNEKNVPFVIRKDNPPNVPQVVRSKQFGLYLNEKCMKIIGKQRTWIC